MTLSGRLQHLVDSHAGELRLVRERADRERERADELQVIVDALRRRVDELLAEREEWKRALRCSCVDAVNPGCVRHGAGR